MRHQSLPPAPPYSENPSGALSLCAAARKAFNLPVYIDPAFLGRSDDLPLSNLAKWEADGAAQNKHFPLVGDDFEWTKEALKVIDWAPHAVCPNCLTNSVGHKSLKEKGSLASTAIELLTVLHEGFPGLTSAESAEAVSIKLDILERVSKCAIEVCETMRIAYDTSITHEEERFVARVLNKANPALKLINQLREFLK